MKFKNKRNALVNWIEYNELTLIILGFIALPVLFYGIGRFNVKAASGVWPDFVNTGTGFEEILAYELVGIIFCLYWGFKILYVVACVALALLLIFGIIYTIAKQPAIIRAAKLPLTVEEIKEGIASGLFSDMQSYCDYIDKQMTFCFGIYHLNFLYQSDNERFLEAATEVFQLKKDKEYPLPLIMRYPNANIISTWPWE